ncbi:MAG: TolC family protein [Candidatus Symbiothrix sp.]|jgi:outer membrane protein TolC|nr:TolC family protein [Candidatus Symbiothrix sp.]
MEKIACRLPAVTKKIIVLLLAALPLPGFSQEKAWTPEECIRYAIQHNPSRNKQEAQNEIYKLNQREAIGGFLPSLNVESGVSMNFGRGLDPETNDYITTNTLGNSYGINSSVTLFDGLSQIYRAKLAKINRLRGNEALQDTKDRIALETMELFFNVLYYTGSVKLAQQQLDESSRNRERIRRMEELGLKSIPDVTEIQAKEAEDRFILTKQSNLLNLEMIKLKTVMNWPLEENLSVAGYEDMLLPVRETGTAMDIYQQALNTLPRALVAGRSLSISETEYKIARGSLFPSLTFSAGFSTGFSRTMDITQYQSFREQLKVRQGSYIALSLFVPIFNGFSRSSELKRSKQRLIIARNEHEETLRLIYSEIEQAVADVNGLADEYGHAQKRTEAMQSAHQVNLRKYEEGLIDALELTTSANRLLNARLEELYTNLKYQLKHKLLSYYKAEL